MRLLSVTGARPQFVKAAPLHAALRSTSSSSSLHTGQHYDQELSQVFNDELGLGEPDVRLDGGSGTHAEQTARMLVGVERRRSRLQAGRVLVYGDTNSTLAGALVAAKLNLPLAHVEAGLRSFDRRMPEEVNRVVCDLLSRPAPLPVADGGRQPGGGGHHARRPPRRRRDGRRRARCSGRSRARAPPTRPRSGSSRGAYALATAHREANTEQPALGRLAEALGSLAEPVVLPLHPRTRDALAARRAARASSRRRCACCRRSATSTSRPCCARRASA